MKRRWMAMAGLAAVVGLAGCGELPEAPRGRADGEVGVVSSALEPRRDDLVLRNPTTGQNYIYRMFGSSPQNLTETTSVQSDTWQLTTAGDFDKDGVSDLFWVNNSSVGEATLWLMNGAASLSAAAQPSVGGPNGWIPGGTGDFNKDGHTDIFWYQRLNGEIATWFMTGTSSTAASRITRPGPGTGWQVAGVGDLNNDGYADVIWRNLSNVFHPVGSVVIWYMNGTNTIGGGSLPSMSDMNWQPVGTGEFDGDQQTDLLWFNTSTRQLLVWKLVNGQPSGSFTLSVTLPSGARPVAVGEFPIKLRIVNATRGGDAALRNCGAVRAGGVSYNMGCNTDPAQDRLVEVSLSDWPYCNTLGFDFTSTSPGISRTTANAADHRKMLFTVRTDGTLVASFEDLENDNDLNDFIIEVSRLKGLNYAVQNHGSLSCR